MAKVLCLAAAVTDNTNDYPNYFYYQRHEIMCSCLLLYQLIQSKTSKLSFLAKDLKDQFIGMNIKTKSENKNTTN